MIATCAVGLLSHLGWGGHVIGVARKPLAWALAHARRLVYRVASSAADALSVRPPPLPPWPSVWPLDRVAALLVFTKAGIVASRRRRPCCCCLWAAVRERGGRRLSRD